MKRLMLLLAFTCIAGVASAQGTETPKKEKGYAEIVFAVKQHDFGKVSESGKKVSYDYVFTNEGDCPLVVTKLMTSCRCVSTEYTKKPVPPGGQGVITVTYNPKKQQGMFYKAIQVYTNTPEKMHIIIAKGQVVE